MLEVIKQLFILISKSKKFWLIPIIIALIIISVVIIAAQLSPVPVFLYPLI